MSKIGDALIQRKEKVNRNEVDFSELQPITIHFDGTISKRKINSDREYTMDMFYAYPGDIVVSKIDLKNGALGIIPSDLSKVAVTGHFAVYKPDLSKLIPEYLYLLVQASFFKKYLWNNKVGAEGRKEVKLNFFEQIKILLPSIGVQNIIIEKWHEAIAQITKSKNRVVDAEMGILDQVLAEADISINYGNKKPRAYGMSFKKIDRWGVEYNRHRWTLENLIQTRKFPKTSLNEIAFINPLGAKQINKDSIVSFVPMEAVSEKDGEIISAQERAYVDVSSGYTRFDEGDVIWAKITPCMQNGKCAVAKGLINGVGFGSTEFHVIRTKDKSILQPEYIWLILRLESIRNAAKRYFIGSAGQQRVPADFLEGLHIPLPPMDVQVELIDKIKKLQKTITNERCMIIRLEQEIKLHLEMVLIGEVNISNLKIS